MIKSIRGFSLLEFIAVMVMISALFALVSPKLKIYRTDFTGAKQAILSSFRYARYLALIQGGTHPPIVLIVSADKLDLRQGDTSVRFSERVYPLSLPNNLYFSQGEGVFYFDQWGNTAAGLLEITDGQQRQQLRVERSANIYAH